MKKTLLLLVVILTASTLYSQTINTIYTWPSTAWTLSGSYAAGNLLSSPTTGGSNFKFDDAQVSNVGDVIYLEAPAIDLRAAFTAGEKVLKINISVASSLTVATSESLEFQYWDATASSWVLMPEGSAPSGDFGNYTTCVIEPIGFYFDFKNLTTTQQQNFKYRLYYNDGGLAQGKGLCLTVNSVTSVDITCAVPTALHTTDVFINGANIGWTANSSETEWDIEYGAANFTLGTGTSDQNSQNSYGLNGLADNTSYDFYVRADCIPATGSAGEVVSAWSAKLNFTTLATCPMPSNGVASYITATSALLKWDPGSIESSWNIEVDTLNTGQGLGVITQPVVSTNSFNAFQGEASTTYEYYIQAKCSGGGVSGWAGPYTFKTGWLNLQWPESDTIELNSSYNVYSKVWIDGLTNAIGQGTGIKVWIGYHNANTNPITWTDWVQATFNGDTDSGGNDEYIADLGSAITSTGTYYYASRFVFYNYLSTPSMPFGSDGRTEYGGFNGGIWNGTTNVSGILTINNTLGIEDQVIEGFNFYPNPTKDKILLNAKQNIDQVEFYNLLGQQVMFKQPNMSTYQLNISNLNTGVYFMKVKVGDKIGTYKVVRQ